MNMLREETESFHKITTFISAGADAAKDLGRGKVLTFKCPLCTGAATVYKMLNGHISLRCHKCGQSVME